MASITIRNFPDESKARLRERARLSGRSLESLVRTILDQAAREPMPKSGFPYDLIALVEPGEDLDPFLEELNQPPRKIDL